MAKLKIQSTGGLFGGRVKWLITDEAESVTFPGTEALRTQVPIFWTSGTLVESSERSVVISLPENCSAGERSVSLNNFEKWVLAHQ